MLKLLSPCWINPFNIAVKSTLSDTDIATLFHKKKKKIGVLMFTRGVSLRPFTSNLHTLFLK